MLYHFSQPPLPFKELFSDLCQSLNLSQLFSISKMFTQKLLPEKYAKHQRSFCPDKFGWQFDKNLSPINTRTKFVCTHLELALGMFYFSSTVCDYQITIVARTERKKSTSLIELDGIRICSALMQLNNCLIKVSQSSGITKTINTGAYRPTDHFLQRFLGRWSLQNGRTLILGVSQT